MSFNENLAKLTVQYSVFVQKGDLVVIQGSVIAEDLMEALYIEVLKAGGHPIVSPGLSNLAELKYEYSSDEQLKFLDPMFKILAEKANKLIGIRADVNTRKLEQVNPEKFKISQSNPEMAELRKMMDQREVNNEFAWAVIPYPCTAYAQEAGMGLHAYTKFIEDALFLNDNPVQHWSDFEKEQDRIIRILETANNIHVLGEDTDLDLSVKGRKWMNSCGKRNMPGGEVFTGPIEDSVNGHIRFSYPGIYMGKEIEDISLEFKDGKVVKGTASKGQELLDMILNIDGANILGEFAIGTNKNITKFTKNMLFDEKMGFCIHCALGRGYPQSGSKNVSNIHWDILKSMKSENSKIFADDKLIYELGEWKI